MGQLFCCRKVDFNQLKYDQYLLQINRYVNNNDSNNNKKNKKNNIFQFEEIIQNNNKNLDENLFPINNKFTELFRNIKLFSIY